MLKRQGWGGKFLKCRSARGDVGGFEGARGYARGENLGAPGGFVAAHGRGRRGAAGGSAESGRAGALGAAAGRSRRRNGVGRGGEGAGLGLGHEVFEAGHDAVEIGFEQARERALARAQAEGGAQGGEEQTEA